MKTIELSIKEADIAQEILHNTRLDSKMEQISTNKWAFDNELEEDVICSLLKEDVTEFDIEEY